MVRIHNKIKKKKKPTPRKKNQQNVENIDWKTQKQQKQQLQITKNSKFLQLHQEKSEWIYDDKTGCLPFCLLMLLMYAHYTVLLPYIITSK